MQNKKNNPEQLPESHSLVSSKSDFTGYAMFPVVDPRDLGFRVVDKCAEDSAI